MELLQARAPGKSICPSEAARRMSPDDWRPLMKQVREAGKQLADKGLIEVTRKGKAVDPHTVKGVIRFRLKHYET